MYGAQHAGVELQPAPARKEDVGGNTVRLPRAAFDVLGLEEGDPVHIEGGASVWARALRAHPDDEGIDVARLAVGERELRDLRVGGKVRVRAAHVRPASELEVTVEDVEDVSADDVREALVRQPIVLAGDRLRLDLETDAGGFDASLSLAGLSLLRVVGRKGSLEGVAVQIVSSMPEGPVRVVEDTELRLKGRDPRGAAR